MPEKQNFNKAVALLILSVSFFLSLLISPRLEGGFQLKWHSGAVINFIFAVIYMVVMAREAKFHGWSDFGTFLVIAGTFLGVFAIANVLLVDPFEGYGLWAALLVEILLIINFRNLFMPFHQRGRRLILNFLMVLLICMTFKYSVLEGILPFLKINSAMEGYLNMPLTAAAWMVSLALSFIGLYLMRLAINRENELQLAVFKQNLGLERKHMLALGLKNEDLLGMTEMQIEDVISDRVTAIMSQAKRLENMKSLVKEIPDPQNSWAAPLLPEFRHNTR